MDSTALQIDDEPVVVQVQPFARRVGADKFGTSREKSSSARARRA
jgi:hypothetical protein